MADKSAKPVKAYKNEQFLASREGRELRILAEYLEPRARFERFQIRDTIVFFGSARAVSLDVAQAQLAQAERMGADREAARAALCSARYYEEARELARRLTLWSKSLKGDDRRFVVCTGGGPGIMEAANRGASEARGLNVGLTISIPAPEFQNPYVTRELAFEFHYFFMRKFWFAYLAKAVVAMPGGFGTLDELFEILTLMQTLKMKKKIPFVLYGTEFWSEVVHFDKLVEYGMISPGDCAFFFRTDSVDEAYDHIVTNLSGPPLYEPGLTL